MFEYLEVTNLTHKFGDVARSESTCPKAVSWFIAIQMKGARRSCSVSQWPPRRAEEALEAGQQAHV